MAGVFRSDCEAFANHETLTSASHSESFPGKHLNFQSMWFLLVTFLSCGPGMQQLIRFTWVAFRALLVEFLFCDLASMMSIREFVRKFKMKKIPLHVLVNNAGVMMVPQRKTRDGFEEHFGLNYLGHFLLTNLLLDTLRESGSPGHSARVVTVSSATHYVAELNMDDLQSSACYSAHAAYAQSKLALVLFTYHLQRLLAAEGSHVTANVVDPGVVHTDLYQHVFWGTRLVMKLFSWLLFKTPDEGAWTSIYAAVTPELEGVGGRYLYNEKETKSLHVTYNQKLQQQLWSKSCDMTGVLDVTL
ncbi:PREDICTED: dehydrogenase/reductase SDR family member on chromosome X isoform X2 [Cercocebus atys]|uniref:dehydrogenase/reductase SDR family member on chromosome X isoform X2 n=1 Tax=Cercocebus atys TaxID=9531 RepID=UPI0005F4C145|nr:PREDICTED: dehydrogenase/reductase SDR family member on chromosome X isoform X2 [Cercocebus atys]